MALNTKGSPAILLLEMLKLMSFSPMAVIMSERQVEEAAEREDAVDGCEGGVRIGARQRQRRTRRMSGTYRHAAEIYLL